MARMASAALMFVALLATSHAGTNEEGKAYLVEAKAKDGVVKLKSGLMYKVLKKGEGKSHPTKDSPCECHYAGTTPALTPNAADLDESEWKEFDSSYKRGEPMTFAPDQVIKGWTEAMQLMVEGDKWEMYIPSELGYGDGGSGEKIKGGDVLIFRMEILKIKGGKKRAVKCDVLTKENCEPNELEVLAQWDDKNLKEVSAEVAKLKGQTDGVLKQGVREKVVENLKILKALEKAKKKAGKGEL